MAYTKDQRPCLVLKFSEIPVGHRAELSHQVTADDVETFGRLTGDFNPIHWDPKFAEKMNFGRPVVYGMLSASFISTVIGMMLPGKGALWTSQTLDFLQPAFVGDTLRVTADVAAKSDASQTLTLSVEITNQNGKTLVRGHSKVRLLSGTAEAKKAHPEPLLSQPTDARVVLVTGGSGGIGSAIARKLADDGFSVAIHYFNSSDAAKDLCAEIRGNGKRVEVFQANLSQADQVSRLFEEIEIKLGPVLNVVHCAASAAIPKPFLETNWEEMQSQMDVQVKGAFLCASRALPAMIQAKSGTLTLIGSIYSDGVPPAQQVAYVAAKTALSAFSRSLAVEFGPKGIRVNVVSPGMTRTSMIADIPEKTKLLAQMQSALRRLADPEDVAQATAFLLSPAARHITGETLRVCGGIAMV
jgi:3-oxoacyl-[acyl-carrier protein] reductase